MIKTIQKYQSRPITVLHILSSAEIAGGERYLQDLIAYSVGLIRHIIILPYKGPFAQILDGSGFRFTVVQLNHKKLIRAIIDISRIIKRKKVDIVHTHGYRANFYGRIASLLTKVKHIATVHVSLLDYKDTPKLLRYLYIILEVALSFKTSRYICISKSMAHDMLRLKIPREKISIIPNGVDLARFCPLSNQRISKDEFGFKTKSILIGTAGRMVSEKGQIYLIEALKQLKSGIGNLKCLFIGNGPLLTIIKNKAAAIGVDDICIFLGTRNDIEKIYPLLDLFVLPSIREPFGLVLLEAMATQIPVIATDNGGPSEYIKSGSNGFLVPPEDAGALAAGIKLVLQNKKKAKEMAAEGRKTVIQLFDVKATVKRIDNLYFTL